MPDRGFQKWFYTGCEDNPGFQMSVSILFTTYFPRAATELIKNPRNTILTGLWQQVRKRIHAGPGFTVFCYRGSAINGWERSEVF